MTDRTDRKLYYLDELSDYKVDSDYPDVRGWDVKDRDGNVIGKVDSLLVNKEAKRVVYLDVEVNDTFAGRAETTTTDADVYKYVDDDDENHLLIPIGTVDLNEEDEYVISNVMDREKFNKIRRFRKGSDITPDYELAVLLVYDDRNDVSDTDDNFYDRKEFQSNYRR